MVGRGPQVTGRQGLRVYFGISSDGYEVHANGFGMRGTQVTLTAGGNATVAMTRTQLAERLYRLTGFGVYFDSALLGLPAPSAHPLLNAGVLGQDSILLVQFAKQLHWFWGDTKRMAFPLGNFETTGATSCDPAFPSDDSGGACAGAQKRVDLTYFSQPEPSTGDVFVRGMAPFEPHNLPTWIGSVAVVPDSGPTAVDGVAMTCLWTKPDHSMSTTRQGAALWDPRAANFSEAGADWPLDGGAAKVTAGCCGQAVTNSAQTKARGGAPTTVVSMDGADYVVFGGQTRGVWPLSVTRVAANLAGLADHTQYENWTPVLPLLNSSAPPADWKVERDEQGTVVWAWRRGAPPLTQAAEQALVASGELKPAEQRTVVHDQDGAPLVLSGGSVHWNAHRGKYIAIVGARPGHAPPWRDARADANIEGAGPWAQASREFPVGAHAAAGTKPHATKPSFDGEIYYAEGDSLTAGWGNATLVSAGTSNGTRRKHQHQHVLLHVTYFNPSTRTWHPAPAPAIYRVNPSTSSAAGSHSPPLPAGDHARGDGL